MRYLYALAAALLFGFTAAPASAQYYGGNGDRGDSIRCESIDGRYNQCRTNGGRAVLGRQISDSPCIEGRSWGNRNGSIWVSNGCRADFYVDGRYGSGNGYGYNQTVRCESRDGRYNRCALPTRGRVVLSRRISSSPCIEGRSWGTDRNSVWVAQGCRADFSVIQMQGGWNYPEYGIGGRIFRCESQDGRYQECEANTRSGVQLIRQLSNAPCIEGRSWGYGRRGIWVAQGCRAEFRSY